MARHNLRDRISAGRGRSPWWWLALGLAPLLVMWLAGCAPSATRIFNQAAPVPAESVLALTYFTTREAGVMGLRGTDGAPLWHTVIGKININWAPVRVGDMLYAVVRPGDASDQHVAAMRLSDGKALWTAPIPRGADSQNDYVAADTTTVVATTGDLDGLAAYDPLTGQLRWQVAMGVAGKPFVRNGMVYVIGSAPNDSAAITALRGTDGAVLWRASAGGGASTSMAANSTTLFAPEGDGAVVALRLSDGHVLWHSPQMARLALPLLATDDMVLVTDGALFGLDARTGAQRWRTTPHGEQVSTNLTLALDTVPSADGVAYVETERGLSAIRLRDGDDVWRASLSGAALVIGGTVYVYRQDLPYCHEDCAAKLAAFDGTTGRLFWQMSPANTSLLAQPEPGLAA